MSNEEAIKILQMNELEKFYTGITQQQEQTALNMVINALKVNEKTIRYCKISLSKGYELIDIYSEKDTEHDKAMKNQFIGMNEAYADILERLECGLKCGVTENDRKEQF